MTCFVGPAVRLPDLGPPQPQPPPFRYASSNNTHVVRADIPRASPPSRRGSTEPRAGGRTGALLAPSPSLPPRFKFNHFEGRGGREALLRTMHGRSLLRWLAVVRAVTMRGRGHDSQGGHMIRRGGDEGH